MALTFHDYIVNTVIHPYDILNSLFLHLHIHLVTKIYPVEMTLE